MTTAEKAKGLFKGITSKVKDKIKGDKEDKTDKGAKTPPGGSSTSLTGPPPSPGRTGNPGGADLSKWEALNKPPPAAAAAAPPPAEPERSVLEDLPEPDAKTSPKLDHVTVDRGGQPAQGRRPPTRKNREGAAVAKAAPAAAARPAPSAPKARPDPPPAANKPTAAPPDSDASGSLSPRNATASNYSTAPVAAVQQEFIRVFLEDNSMKAVGITPPCTIGELVDSLRKKMYLVDTTSFQIFEVKGGKTVRIPASSEDLHTVMAAWDGNPQYKFVFKSADSASLPADADAAEPPEVANDPFPVHHMAAATEKKPPARAPPAAPAKSYADEGSYSRAKPPPGAFSSADEGSYSRTKGAPPAAAFVPPAPDEAPPPPPAGDPLGDLLSRFNNPAPDEAPEDAPPPVPDEPPPEEPPAPPKKAVPEPEVFAQPADLSSGSALSQLLAARKAAAKPAAVARPAPPKASPAKPAAVAPAATPAATPPAKPAAVPAVSPVPAPATASPAVARPATPTPVAKPVAKPTAKPGAKSDLSKKPPRTWTTEEVVEWLNGCGLTSHSWVFFERRVTGQQLMDVSPAYLQGELEITDEAVVNGIVKAVERLKEERLNMLKNLRAGTPAAASPAAAAAPAPAASPAPAPAPVTTPAATTPAPKASSLKPALAPKAVAKPVAAAPAGAAAAGTGTGATPATPVVAKPVANPKASPLKPTAPAVAAEPKAKPGASAPVAKPKAREVPGVTLDGTGEGIVRVYFSDTQWRAFLLTGSTTVNDLCAMIRTQYADLLNKPGEFDVANGALFEAKHAVSADEKILDGAACPLAVCKAWVGNGYRLIFKDKASGPPKPTKEVMKVFFADGNAKALVVASSVTVAELCQMVADAVKVDLPTTYHLYEVDDSTGESTMLYAEDNIWTLKARWLGSDDFKFVYANNKPASAPADAKDPVTLPVQKRSVPKNKAAIEQVRAFTGWANVVLAKKGVSIDNLEAAFRDGVKLHTLMEAVAGKPVLGKCVANPVILKQRLDNVSAVVSYWTSKGWSLAGFGPEDVVDGNMYAIVQLLWPIVCNSFQSVFKPATEQEARAELLQWARARAAPVRIENFESSWKDGMALCTVLAKSRPALLSLATVEASREQAVPLAVAGAEAAGLPRGMLWLDSFLQADWTPDEGAVFAYLVALRLVLSSPAQ